MDSTAKNVKTSSRLRSEEMETQQEKRYPASIITAISKVMADCKTVPKTGSNKFHNYKYATDDDLLSMVRPLMAKYGLVLIPSLSGIPTSTDVKTKNGTAVHVSVMMEHTLAAVGKDGEVGDVWPEKIISYGEAIDNGDKGFYKASTGANKYTIFRLFQLAAGDDPEQDGPELEHQQNTGADKSSEKAQKVNPQLTSEVGKDPVPLNEIEKILEDGKEIGLLNEVWEEHRLHWFGRAGSDEARKKISDMYAEMTAKE